MKTETEKEFYEAFDIPKRFYASINIGDLDYQPQEVSSPTLRKLWNQVEWHLISHEDIAPETYAEFKKSDFWSEEYPEITDRILLELIVINNENAPAVGKTLEELRNQVLYWCIVYKNRIYNQVRKLFGEK